jgi:hypothetical protein
MLRASVVQVDACTDVGFELSDGGVNTSLDLLSGEFSEPVLDLIDPCPGSRRSGPDSAAGGRDTL